MAKKVRIDEEACIGCGACTGICPDIFAINDAGKAAVVAEPTDADDASVDEAVASCPVSAISAE